MKMDKFISNLAKRKIPGEETFKIITKGRCHDTISLGMGEPDFQMPDVLFDYIQAIKSSGYSPPSGIPQLKDAICKKLENENKILTQPHNIVVTCGATEGLFLASLATVNPQDEIILPNPNFLIMRFMFEIFNGKPIDLQLKEEEQFEINPDSMKKLITDMTKIIVINSPSNPTGSVLNKNTLEEIADIAIEHDLLIFSDEAYENLFYDRNHYSMASLNGMNNRVISFYTFSKTWAIPGFRLGYLCAPPDIAHSITKLHPYTTVCAPTISQILGTRILENSDNLKCYINDMIDKYKKKRNFMVRRLNEIGLRTINPMGAFYTFSNIKLVSKNSVNFSHLMLEKAKVVIVPGSEFGKYGEGYVRCSYATSMQNISEAMDRIENALKFFNR